jgi:hypothetical protein
VWWPRCGELQQIDVIECVELMHLRAMNDADGPQIAKLFYEKLFSEDIITLDSVPYALDHAVSELRASGVPPERWAPFVHIGA